MLELPSAVRYSTSAQPSTDPSFLRARSELYCRLHQIALYNDKDMNAAQGPRFLHKLIYKNATVSGFVVSKYKPRAAVKRD